MSIAVAPKSTAITLRTRCVPPNPTVYGRYYCLLFLSQLCSRLHVFNLFIYLFSDRRQEDNVFVVFVVSLVILIYYLINVLCNFRSQFSECRHLTDCCHTNCNGFERV